MSQQLQPTVSVGLILAYSHEAKWCGVGASFANRHAETIVERAVGSGLRTAGDAACAPKCI